MEKFNFISYDLFRKTLENDYKELEKGLESNCYKSVLILSGSIIEAILIEYLISLGDRSLNKSKLLKWDLNKAITKCKELNIISKKAENLSVVVKDFRNLIHPGKTIRTQIEPNKDDAIVAKSLVEIIIKEINTKKQELYGFTAEQVLSKIEKDATSEVIWHHLLKKLNIHEKKRLLIENISERYFNLIYDPSPNTNLHHLSKFFKTIYISVNKSIRKEVANKFISILLEGSSLEVSQHIESFFIIEYLEYYSNEDQILVKDHLFGFINNGINENVSKSLMGISKYLTEKEYHRMVEILFGIYSFSSKNKGKDKDEAKYLLDHEYHNTTENNKQYIMEFLNNQIEIFKLSGNFVKKVNELKDYLNDELI